MKFIYKIPGYILLLFGGFCLSWGGLIIRQFEEANVWDILLLRSFFFLIALLIFLFSIYRFKTFKIIGDSGFSAVIGGFFLSLSFVAYTLGITSTSVANVVFIISTQTMFLAIFGYFFLKEKISLTGFISIILAMIGISIMVGDSITTGSLFGNLVSLAIPLNFTILVIIIRKNPKLDMVPAIFYAGIFACIYGLLLSDSLRFTNHDILMGFALGVPQLAFGFICITIGSKTTKAVTVGVLMLSETIFAPIWVWLFLNEIPPLSVFIGGFVIILAVIIKGFDKNKPAIT
jgi:drug/metabolite transporter (DMT)-like permease|tara:strand:- start:86 stop:952 length:867 start_codon:yes stop_codon:yes gene_type:complete